MGSSPCGCNDMFSLLSCVCYASPPSFSRGSRLVHLSRPIWATESLRVARRWGWDRLPPSWEPGDQDAGDPEGPPIHPSSTLAPTDVDELVLGLRRIGRPLLLPSFSPPHKKNDQKNSLGARLTTRQTIASPSPVHIKISSPISKKSLAKSETFSQKSLASRSQSPGASKSAQRAHLATDATSATSATSATKMSTMEGCNELCPLGEPIYVIKTIH